MSFLFHPLARVAASGSRNLFTSAVRYTVRPSVKARPRSLLWGTAFVFSASLALSSTIHLDSEVPTPTEATETFTDPATSIAFPTTLRVPAKIKLPTLSLVGVGVRTVSFLGIKVYSVGFYADLDNPDLKVPKGMTPDEKIHHIVQNTACVIRIVPTRSTSYTHLRDAFMRALQARMLLGRERGTLSEEVEQAAGSPMRKLKSLFPNSPLTKHTPLDIFLTPPTPGRPRALVFRDLGAVENDWVAVEFVLAYFEGDGPSPPLKESVTARLESFEK